MLPSDGEMSGRVSYTDKTNAFLFLLNSFRVPFTVHCSFPHEVECVDV
jgi:hypothetical protein